MLDQSTSLSGAFATLRADLERTQAPAWVPEAIHALILALFARIFDRLEHLLHLWETNQLPKLPQPRPTAPRRTPRRTRPRHVAPGPRLRRIARTLPEAAPEPMSRATPCATPRAPIPRAHTPRRQFPIRPARAPPTAKVTVQPDRRPTPSLFLYRNA